MKLKIGVLGGSFNPPHKGHTFLASYAKETCGLSKVVFIPTGKHAFDSKGGMTPAFHRMKMVELASKGKSDFELSDIEARQPEKSYTYNTLRLLKNEFGDNTELCFITGTDEILEIHRWYEWEKLLNEFEFIIAARPGVDLEEAESIIEVYRRECGARITLLKDIPAPDISSTKVRSFIEEVWNCIPTADSKKTVDLNMDSIQINAQKLDTKNLPIEEEVLEYIIKNNIYRESEI